MANLNNIENLLKYVRRFVNSGVTLVPLMSSV